MDGQRRLCRPIGFLTAVMVYTASGPAPAARSQRSGAILAIIGVATLVVLALVGASPTAVVASSKSFWSSHRRHAASIAPTHKKEVVSEEVDDEPSPSMSFTEHANGNLEGQETSPADEDEEAPAGETPVEEAPAEEATAEETSAAPSAEETTAAPAAAAAPSGTGKTVNDSGAVVGARNKVGKVLEAYKATAPGPERAMMGVKLLKVKKELLETIDATRHELFPDQYARQTTTPAKSK